MGTSAAPAGLRPGEGAAAVASSWAARLEGESCFPGLALGGARGNHE